MDRLCTPWRFKYVTGMEKEEGCVFCNRLACEEAEHFVLHRGRHWYLILNLYPYNNGHLLLVLNRHQPMLAGCTPEELAEMGVLLKVMEIVEGAGTRLALPTEVHYGARDVERSDEQTRPAE